ncbi:histidine phosphatase family protein [Floricoccus penangensis]|uniref:Phosphoglycerate mutase n=1 Tax=Floricoccus penangensis TaxID=1859475 RepID=A0A9Q5JHQ6_9LACT|nr:histidine phosphatase family protein [Floricoccus penangensis]OFI47531.1 phosphoglycerate mutase [Floricoccus penangensis]URZ87952.1 phosphoglycerate mutase family protein [Floricoccus penangensis]
MVKIYLVRHGKTMFNTIGRAQGWSDTPLTKEGQLGITELGLGFKIGNIKFDRAYSSDSGRTLQTMNLILENSDNEGITYTMDPRIREWCFGSMDGAYDGELFGGVLPRTEAFGGRDIDSLTYEDIANGIMEVDTAGWAESWDVLSNRIITGFTELAQESEDFESEEIVVVSHGMTIATFIHLIDPSQPRIQLLDNGSVTELEYKNGQFEILKIGDMSYRQEGRKFLENED